MGRQYLDWSSTHSFTNIILVKKLGLAVSQSKDFDELVENRKNTSVKGLFLNNQGVKIAIDFQLFPTRGSQVVLAQRMWGFIILDLPKEFYRLT